MDSPSQRDWYPHELRKKETEALRERRQAVDLDPAVIDDTLGIALSGGGIRSATFSLGLLQALAKAGLLLRIDYLSTISGGGYIGAFLGRLFMRIPEESPKAQIVNGRQPPANAQDVEDLLKDSQTPPLHWLRENGRYLSPNGSGDLLLGVAVVLRSWVSIHVVLALFVLMQFLFYDLIRYGVAPLLPDRMTKLESGIIWWSPYVWLPALLLVCFVIPIGGAYWLVPLPKTNMTCWEHFKTRYLSSCIALAFGVTAGILASVWMPQPSHKAAAYISLLLVVITVLALVWYGIVRAYIEIKLFCERVEAEKHRPKKPESGETYSNTSPDELDAAELTRRNLSVLLSTFLTLTVGALFFALIDSLGQTLYATWRVYEGNLATFIGAVAVGLATIAASARKIAVFFGGQPNGKRPKLSLNVAAHLAAFGLVLLLLVILCAIGHGIAYGGNIPTGNPGRPSLIAVGLHKTTEAGAVRETSVSDKTVLTPKREVTVTDRLTQPAKKKEPSVVGNPMSWLWLCLGFIATAVLSIGFARIWPFLNRSSLQTLYSARLSRAYLGASNPKRWNGAHSTVEVIDGDGMAIQRYSPHEQGGPLHLISVTINETLDGKSQLEQKDRKGLPMAIGPCGISVGARHHAQWHDGGTGDGDLIGYRAIEPIRAAESTSFSVFDPKASIMASATSAPEERGVRGLRHHPECPKATDTGIEVEALKLEDWVAISGAAFSTGLGSRTSLGFSLLCGLFNVRLGYWWDSCISPKKRAHRVESNPMNKLGSTLTELFPVQMYLLDEFTARYHGTARQHWCLSDGGHFENMGAYELIRRRIPKIIVFDGEQDAEFCYEGLAKLVQKARADFATEIEFLTEAELKQKIHESLTPYFGTLEQLRRGKWSEEPVEERVGADPNRKRRSLDVDLVRFSLAHAALARICYPPDQSGTAFKGTLLYIKATLTGDEPVDVLHYHKLHPNFPHEPTSDQFFDEAQWESYRKLGEHIGEKLFDKKDTAPLTPLWSPYSWIVQSREDKGHSNLIAGGAPDSFSLLQEGPRR